MQRNERRKLTKRICAAFLSFVMVLTLIPASTLSVLAATPEHENAITISVVDENDKALSDATVTFSVDADANLKQSTETTDAYGTVVVMTADEFEQSKADNLRISATISKEGYATDQTTIENMSLTSGTQDLQVKLKSTQIKDVKVTATSEYYNGQAFDAASISGVKETDIITYKLNDAEWKNWREEVPKISELGSYSLTIKVEREGFEDYIETVQPKIEKGNIELNVESLDQGYTGEELPALKITSGLKNGDVVTFVINGSETETTVTNENEPLEAPPIVDAGEYSVKVKVHRDEKYKDYEKDYTAKITQVSIKGLSATLNSWTYDGKSHPVVKVGEDGKAVKGTKPNDVVKYKVDDGEWSKEIPEVTYAGEYTVKIQVSRDKNYTDTEVIDLNPAKVVVKQAEQEIEFNHYSSDSVSDVVKGEFPDIGKTYDFSAKDVKAVAGGSFTYSIDDTANTADTEENKGVATIDATTGMLTAYMPGKVTVVATLSSNDKNYSETSKRITLTITQEAEYEGQYVKFTDKEVSYTLGENEGIVSAQKAVYAGTKRHPRISYSIENENIGVKCDSESGEIKIKDYKKLADELIKNDGVVKIKVTATMKKFGWFSKDDKTSYEITIHFAQTPDDPYVITGTMGKNNWYTSAISVSPSDSTYEITDDLGKGFSSNVTFNDEGTGERYVYLKSATGAITNRILLDGVKIDTVKPDSNKIKIEYSESVLSKILWFYDGPVTINFTAYDVTSGVDSFDWTYRRSTDASTSNLEADNGTVSATRDSEDTTKYTASITLPKSEAEQLRGYISVNATDNAGLTSEDKTDDGRVIVVDTISPTRSVAYALEEAGGTSQTVANKHYFSNNVKFTFDITEANFYEDDVIVKVSKNNGEAKPVSVKWNDTDNQDEHEATCVLSGDGDYIVTMEYADRSGHKMENYQSEVVTIDTTAPVINFEYSNGNKTSADKDNKQMATISVTEHNFRASDIEVTTVAKNIKGDTVAAKDIQEILQNAEWSQHGDVYTTTLSSEFVDAIYEMTLNYKDLALNPAKEVKTGEFIVDHTAPAADSMQVTYSTPLTERIISAITFGYYNPSVEVTFTAKDVTSGVDYFMWSYLKEDGVSDSNVASYPDAKLEAKQDANDKSKFTASKTLPKTTAEQLRGSIAFTATDKYSNVSNKLTDEGHVIVVDTIAPTLTAEYTESARTVGNRMYYNRDMTATFTVTEANFYPEDVHVEVSKDGGDFNEVSPTWKDNSTDVHVGTYTIKAPSDHSGDADYVFRVRYTDRSNNEMSAYTSDIITIDTIKPVINVTYSNQNVKNNINDSEGHARKYFDSTQTATVTITEHNFEASEVDFTIGAKDAAGNALNANELNTKSSWSTSGDKHTITITYPGDANYTFDVAYTDLATNAADNYAEDYFTVDKTAPTNLNVSYSNSILDTVLQAITFGFYNAKMTVTINATDNISGVHDFKYSYSLASGVSSVNAELINQAIEEAGITYTAGRTKATTRFEIPKAALGNSNQFNGNVSFTATDRSGNESSKFNDTKRLVVDNISPTATVEYNSPVQTVGGIAYYDGTVNATVTINEANFYAEDVQVSVTKDGAAYSVTPSWSNNSTDVHVGTFALSDDGDYFVTINYADKSSNKMATYTSEQMTVDTEIVAPVITVNGEEANGKAYKDEVVPAVSFEDVNFENYEISLTRTRYDDKDVDVKEKFIAGNVSVNDQGGTGSFDTFVKEQDVDGIYTMTVSMTDKAGHSAETSATFTVNRFGSVYEYGDYLTSLVKDGGAYVQEVKNDLIITEYNADRLLSNSLDVEVSCDGKPLTDVSYDVTPQIHDQVSVGSSGWYQYKYTISKSNFDSDGVYKIAISSKDATGNAPETTNYEDKNILFRVDSTAPEINSITGFEDSIINAQSVTSKYTVYDTIGLASIKVYVDGENVDTITDFNGDVNNYSGSFKVSEKNSAQKIRLVVEDLAGNVTDTDSDDFESAFAFNKSVTVSTNFFVRFYANKVLFWGTIGGIVIVIGGIGFIIEARLKKKRNN